MTAVMEPEEDDPGSADFPISTQPEAATLRSERAQEILEEIGFISGSAGITSNAILFVEDMQHRLTDCQARKIFFPVSEKQLEWLEGIREKIS